MIATNLLIQNKLKLMKPYKKREFLLNCISKNFEKINILDTEISKDITDISKINICKICESSEFYLNNYEEICKNCGYTVPIEESKFKTFEKIEYIKPGSNKVKIEINGTKVNIDLNKINLWIKDSDPFAKDINIIRETLEIIFTTKGNLTENIINSCISIYINFNVLISKIDIYKKHYNKKAIIALCIHFGCSIHNVYVSLEQLSIIFKIPIQTINLNLNFFKDIFNETDYNEYFNLKKTIIKFPIELTKENQLIYNKMKIQIVKHFNIKEPLEPKYQAAIVYFITNKNPKAILKYTYNEVAKIFNISIPIISQKVKVFDEYYKKNPKLLKELFNL